MTIEINKPRPAAKPNQHAVFALTKRGGGYRKVRLSAWGTLSEIESVYDRLEAFNPRNAVLHAPPQSALDAPLGAGGGPILWLAIRSQADPQWNTAKRCTAVRRDKSARKARTGVRAL